MGVKKEWPQKKTEQSTRIGRHEKFRGMMAKGRRSSRKTNMQVLSKKIAEKKWPRKMAPGLQVRGRRRDCLCFVERKSVAREKIRHQVRRNDSQLPPGRLLIGLVRLIVWTKRKGGE